MAGLGAKRKPLSKPADGENPAISFDTSTILSTGIAQDKNGMAKQNPQINPSTGLGTGSGAKQPRMPCAVCGSNHHEFFGWPVNCEATAAVAFLSFSLSAR